MSVPRSPTSVIGEFTPTFRRDDLRRQLLSAQRRLEQARRAVEVIEGELAVAEVAVMEEAEWDVEVRAWRQLEEQEAWVVGGDRFYDAQRHPGDPNLTDDSIEVLDGPPAAGSWMEDVELRVCSICLDEVRLSQTVSKLKRCQHVFHRGCATRMFFTDTGAARYPMPRCPVCRETTSWEDRIRCLPAL